MTARNDITGDALKTGAATKQYRDGWDRIFGKDGQPKTTEEIEKDRVATLTPDEQAAHWAAKAILASKV